MEFTEYLGSKNIDPKKFLGADPEMYQELKKLFDQVHPNSFTAQKLFLINAIRRKYPLVEQPIADSAVQPGKMKSKIVVKPKPKLK